MKYIANYTNNPPAMNGDWHSTIWRSANVLEITHFRSESSNHRPRTLAKLLYNEKGFYGIFNVKDNYVRCVHTDFQSNVWKDSCVEFFVQPKPEMGYFNFEFNCVGALLSSYIEDPTREEDGFKKFIKLLPEEGKQIRIYHSLPKRIYPEIQQETHWFLEFFIPFSLLSRYVGSLNFNKEWRANFYKCSEDNSHPHWEAWSPVDEFNFHLPRCFGTISFAEHF